MSPDTLGVRSAAQNQLDVRTGDPQAEVFVLDSRSRLVIRSIGTVHSFHLPDGIYTIKVRTGSTIEEKDIVLLDGISQRMAFDAQPFASPAPLAGTSKTHEHHIEAAKRHSISIDVNHGTGSSIFVFVRAWTSSAENALPTSAIPAAGLKLFERKAGERTEVADLSTQATTSMQGDPWSAFTISVDPGLFELELALPSGDRLHQTIVAPKDWHVQVFMLLRPYTDELDGDVNARSATWRADLAGASIHICRGLAFNEHNPAARDEELARQALATKRSAPRDVEKRELISPEARSALLHRKFQDPMLGIFGGHLLLMERPVDIPLLQEVVGNLRSLVGNDHPDVEALALKAFPDAPAPRVDAQPMLRRSWCIITSQSILRDIPGRAMNGGAPLLLWTEDPWHIWRTPAPSVSDDSDQLSDLEETLAQSIGLTKVISKDRRQRSSAPLGSVGSGSSGLAEHAHAEGNVAKSDMGPVELEMSAKELATVAGRFGLPKQHLERLLTEVASKLNRRHKAVTFHTQFSAALAPQVELPSAHMPAQADVRAGTINRGPIMSRKELRARSLNEQILRADPLLAAELQRRLTELPPVLEGMAFDAPAEVDAEPFGAPTAFETIVLKVGRPVLAIKQGATILEIAEPESQVWKERLTAAHARLIRPIESVGRVELKGDPNFAWVGTAWRVAEDIVVTNRHVAREFARLTNTGYVFRDGTSGLIAASVDFLEEIGRNDSLSYEVSSVLHIEDESGPDVAFMKLKRNGRGAVPIPLSTRAVVRDQIIAVIGYPARDSRIPDAALMDRIFGDVYDKKRLAPGQVIGRRNEDLLHDCSTLGGNSGSTLIDLSTGEAVGLHFAGRYLQANFAVPSDIVAERLRAVMEGRARRVGPEALAVASSAATQAVAAPASSPQGGVTLTYDIPLRITVTIGVPTVDGHTAPAAAALPAPVRSQPDVDDDAITIELPFDPARYDNRDGYNPAFLRDGLSVPLPKIGPTHANDVLSYESGSGAKTVLPYRHFSVVMSENRRMCYYSAVNIDGSKTKKFKRTGWRFDSRIPREYQILKECYGNEPKFSRGHMTRREDPIWGSDSDASEGNDDSMHATNAVPQMQSFNAGIWLGLENYALVHARDDDMKISVFTGPFFARNDPIMYRVKIPRSFWKVIAFVHDETGKLCATGYTMNQSSFLQEEEFVFGKHVTSQIPISTIEERADISFGQLASLDPLADGEEAVMRPLNSVEQVRFI